jgi:nucleoside-diphosphate-sugar epimerase
LPSRQDRTKLDLEYTEDRTGEAVQTHVAISKANKLLGYEPADDIREMTRRFIARYRENEEWYDRLVRDS